VKLRLPKSLKPRKDAIVYNVLATPDGWQVQAFLPKRISPSDRCVVLDWFHEYRSKVQALHPIWLTTFRFAEQVYFLDIVRIDDPKDRVARAIDLVQQSQQLDLDLNYA